MSEKTAPKGYIKSDKTYEIAIWDGTVHFYNENPANPDEQYTDYEQVTFVNKAEKPNPQSPKTGDHGLMSMWIAVLLVSAAGITGTIVYGRKKKDSAE